MLFKTNRAHEESELLSFTVLVEVRKAVTALLPLDIDVLQLLKTPSLEEETAFRALVALGTIVCLCIVMIIQSRTLPRRMAVRS